MTYRESIDYYCSGLKGVNPGKAECCPECNPDDLTQDELEDDSSFSWSSCDTCGSSLGGNRSDGHGFDGDTVIHLSMCDDCVVFFANGDEPEGWS